MLIQSILAAKIYFWSIRVVDSVAIIIPYVSGYKVADQFDLGQIGHGHV